MVALVSTTLILAASWLFFGVTLKGSLVLLYLTTILFLFASLGIGILISSIVSTQQAAFMISAILTVLPTLILTGFVFPIRNMPPMIQVISVRMLRFKKRLD
jgi:ABC-2 type transport system permease protein